MKLQQWFQVDYLNQNSQQTAFFHLHLYDACYPQSIVKNAQ
uniref:Uncharacterized protein n=1 Tax=Meloidogyne enterolobii TaxID=390850 RepID=A0A6V7VNY2_MELEN|nr:unnamed protein product [Meloidogyne enterolobii]